MQVRTDDDVYRVDAVWLGPPRATFPWRARYAAYGVGLLVMVAVMFVQRRLGISLGFFSVAWALLVTVTVTRFVGRRIDEDRPLVEWLVLFVHELRGPRRRTATTGGPLESAHVRVRPTLETPAPQTTTHVVPAGDDFGPPSSTTVGAPVRRRRPGVRRSPAPIRALPPSTARTASAAEAAASWARPDRRGRRRTPAVRVPSGRLDRPHPRGEGRGTPPSDRH